MDTYRKSELEELEDDFFDDDVYRGPDLDEEPSAHQILGVEAMFRADTRMRQVSKAILQNSVGYSDDGDRVRPLDFG
jgi:hypothetical protein